MDWTIKRTEPERRRIERAEQRTVGRDQAVRGLQQAIARHTRLGERLSERLIAERRAEAAREPS